MNDIGQLTKLVLLCPDNVHLCIGTWGFFILGRC